jgi:probable selenium-dependent hydroxylase accessory protein YqeC
MVSFIGAGGKTTSLFHLASELRAEGKKLLVTTTTKIFRPAKPHVDRLFLIDDVNAFLSETAGLVPPVIICAGRSLSEDGKLIGLPVGWLAPLQASGQFNAILIEADGAASRLFKVPAETEPVVPESSTVVIWVMSIKAVGKPLDSRFVHRAERAVGLLDVSPETLLSSTVILRLLEHPLGPLKGIPPGCRKIALLNQADSPADVTEAQRLAQTITPLGFDRIVISSFINEQPLQQIASAKPVSR